MNDAPVVLAVVLLSSAAGDFIHGSVLPVDGGWLGR